MKNKLVRILVSTLLVAEMLFGNLPLASVSVLADNPVPTSVSQDNEKASENQKQENATESETLSENSTEIPSQTEETSEKIELKFLDKENEFIQKEVCYGTKELIFDLDNSWLTVDGKSSIEDDVKVRVKVRLNKRNVTNDFINASSNGKTNFWIDGTQESTYLICDDSSKYFLDNKFVGQLRKKLQIKITQLPLTVEVKTNGKENIILYEGQSIGTESPTHYTLKDE